MFDSRVFRLLVAAMVCTIAAEMSFTLYSDVYGVANMVGHLFKGASFFLVYRAVVVTSLAAPYEMLFHDLMRSRDDVLRERDQAQRYLDVAEVILLVLDVDGRIRLINRKGAEALGATESELIGRDWYGEFVPPAHRDEARELFSRMMGGESEGAEHSEGVLRTCAGAERIVSWHNTPITDASGTVTAVLRSGEDVTDRRNAEARLIESEQRFRRLFERAPDAYYLSDLQGRFVDANAVAETLTGYTKEELLGRSFLDCGLLRPEEVLLAARLLSLSAQGKPTGPDELTLISKDGTPIAVDIRTEPLSLEGEALILGIAHDVSERRAAAERIRLERDYFLSLFSNSPEAIALLDADYRVVDVNAAFSGLFHYDRDAAVGRRIDDLVVPVELQHEARELTRLGKAGQAGFVAETVRRTRDGSHVIVSISDAPVISEGRTVGVFAMYRDIGEQKRAADAIRAVH
jgi:PAS domain S-box-containing protein